jgi:hypothetical protein
MPVRKVPGGYQWGSRGKVYKTKAAAERQGRAAYASGYKEAERKAKGGKTKSRVNEAGNYTKPGMRKRLFEEIKAGGKGGKPGQWSGRKAQMLAKRYKDAGGGYRD